MTVEDRLDKHPDQRFDRELNSIIEEELLKLRDDKDLLVHIQSPGFVVAAKPRLTSEYLFLTTLHNGTYIPTKMSSKCKWGPEERLCEEDIGTADLYRDLFHEFGGIWFNTLFSRFWIDLNRSEDEGLLKYGKNEKEENNYNFKKPAFLRKENEARKFYKAFYKMVRSETKDKMFLFSGHSMREHNKDKSIRPDYCLIKKNDTDDTGLKHILTEMGYDAQINNPFKYDEGHFMVYMESILNNYRSVEFETNKSLYTTKDRTIIDTNKLNQTKETILKAMKKII